MGLLARLSGKSKASTKTPASGHEVTNNKYRGVEIVTDQSVCCQAVQAIADQRFLVEQAPILPLEDCDAANCQCTYKRFDDRRGELRRAADVAFDVATQLHEQDNRASTSRGRRSDD